MTMNRVDVVSSRQGDLLHSPGLEFEVSRRLQIAARVISLTRHYIAFGANARQALENVLKK